MAFRPPAPIIQDDLKILNLILLARCFSQVSHTPKFPGFDVDRSWGPFISSHRGCPRPGISPSSPGFFEWEMIFQIHRWGLKTLAPLEHPPPLSPLTEATGGRVTHCPPRSALRPAQAAARPRPPVLRKPSLARMRPPELLCACVRRERAHVLFRDFTKALLLSRASFQKTRTCSGLPHPVTGQPL